MGNQDEYHAARLELAAETASILEGGTRDNRAYRKRPRMERRVDGTGTGCCPFGRRSWSCGQKP